VRYVLSIPDPVHNYIRLNKLEKTLIGLPKFQRLKRIKQLGVASVVFPGALHTRFEHSLGTMHVADMIFDRFSDDFEEIDRYKVRLAGLLHDIGHSAFSHTIEQGLRRIEKIVEPRYKRHESYTRNIISNLAKANIVKKALKEAGIQEDSHTFFKKISHIATGKRDDLDKTDRFLSSIISGEIDADRIDYLIRDGLHTGINFIGFDLQHILENISRDNDKLALGKGNEITSFDEIVATNIGEAFLISRYHYYSDIINHPGNIAANTMLIKALESTLFDLLKNTNKEEVKKEMDKFYYEYDDNDLLNFIYKNGNEQAKSLINNLKEGNILCCFCDLKNHALDPKTKLYLELIKRHPYFIDEIEKDINKLVVKGSVFLNTSDVKGVPTNLRIKICKNHRFLYDESKLAASLIMEILSSDSLYFFTLNQKNQIKLNKFIRENWAKIEESIERKIRQERNSNEYGLELLLLFFHELIKINRNLKQPTKFITHIYEMIYSIQKNHPGTFEYNFHEDFGFLYSSSLFKDIMKLGSIGLLKISIEEGRRPLHDYCDDENNSLLDYIKERNYIYYKFGITEEGEDYCNEIMEEYKSYVNLFTEELPHLL